MSRNLSIEEVNTPRKKLSVRIQFSVYGYMAVD